MALPSDDPVLLDGPWEHRFVAANGARFHIVECGEGPAVILVHGYPGFWWTWRDLLPALADAGYRAVAVDARGFGGSDKPPAGYDLGTAAADLTAVARSLGETEATFVGHGLGAWTGRFLARLHPAETHGLALISMPHPTTFDGYADPLLPGRRERYLRGLRAPFSGPTDPAADAARATEAMLREGGGVHTDWVTDEVVTRHAAALALPFVSHATDESFKRLRPRRLQRRRLAAIADPPDLPVLLVHGSEDAYVPSTLSRDIARDQGSTWQSVTLPGVGHFVPEEAPQALADTLVTWLDSVG